MNRKNLIGAKNDDDDEKVKKLEFIMEILPIYLKNKHLNIRELLEERNWPEPNSININDELKLKALKYINEVSGSKFSFNGVGTQIIKMSELFILWVLWVIKIFLFILFLKLFCISFIFFLFVSYPIIE
jgi:hypothetical protein